MSAGFGVLVLAGLFQGSFGRGYKNHKPYSWSVFWGVYNVFCIIVSVAFVLVLSPKLLNILFLDGAGSVIKAILCGAVWGASAICFSKAIDTIGMSLVYGISMGISTLSGSITPMIINQTFPSGKSAALFLVSLVLTLLGVVVITVAGVKRDGATKSSVIGIVLSVFSGLGAGIMNLGFSFSGDIFSAGDGSYLALSTAKWLPVLVGGCLTGLLYCIGETTALKQWNTLVEKGSGLCSAKLFATSVVWYLALILYGVSTSMLGAGGSSVGWILFNSFALIVSAFWGLKTGEWKGKKKNILFAGCAILLVSWAVTYFVFI